MSIFFKSNFFEYFFSTFLSKFFNKDLLWVTFLSTFLRTILGGFSGLSIFLSTFLSNVVWALFFSTFLVDFWGSKAYETFMSQEKNISIRDETWWDQNDTSNPQCSYISGQWHSSQSQNLYIHQSWSGNVKWQNTSVCFIWIICSLIVNLNLKGVIANFMTSNMCFNWTLRIIFHKEFACRAIFQWKYHLGCWNSYYKVLNNHLLTKNH